MLKCLNKKECTLKDLLTVLCNHKKFQCKEGSFKTVLDFLKKKKAKAVILLIRGKITEEKAKEYAFLVSEVSKTKKVVWAVHKEPKLRFKVLKAL